MPQRIAQFQRCDSSVRIQLAHWAPNLRPNRQPDRETQCLKLACVVHETSYRRHFKTRLVGNRLDRHELYACLLGGGCHCGSLHVYGIGSPLQRQLSLFSRPANGGNSRNRSITSASGKSGAAAGVHYIPSANHVTNMQRAGQRASNSGGNQNTGRIPPQYRICCSSCGGASNPASRDNRRLQLKDLKSIDCNRSATQQ